MAELPRSLRHLNDVELTRLIGSLTHIPVPIIRGKAIGSTIARDPSHTIRKTERAPKGLLVADPFDFDAWKKQQQSLGAEFQKEEKKPQTIRSARIIEALSSAVGFLHARGVADNLKVPEDAGKVDSLERWTGKEGQFIGELRHVFGRAFVNIARLFLWAREKFRLLIKGHKKEAPDTPGGGLGAVVRILFKIAKAALVAIMPQITDRLWQSLTTGLTNKIKSWIPQEITDDYELLKEKFQEIKEQLEAIAGKQILSWLGELEKPVLEILDKIGAAVKILNTVKEIVASIKTAIRIANCVEAEVNPAGCVASLFGPEIDFLIEKIVENCSVRKTIIPRLLKLRTIRTDAPNWIADKLISFARDLLPDGLKDFLAPLDTTTDYYPKESDLPCKEEPTPLERALEKLAFALDNDEAKIFALGELLSALGGEDLKNITPEKVLELANLVRIYNISAEQMSRWARDLGTPPKDIPGDVVNVFMAISSGEPAPKQFDTTGNAQTLDGGGGTGGTPGGKQGAGGRGSDSGAGGVGGGDGADGRGQSVPVVTVDQARYSGTGAANQPRSGFQIVIKNLEAVRKKGVGSEVIADITGFWDGKPWHTVVGVHGVSEPSTAKTFRFTLRPDRHWPGCTSGRGHHSLPPAGQDGRAGHAKLPDW